MYIEVKTLKFQYPQIENLIEENEQNLYINRNLQAQYLENFQTMKKTATKKFISICKKKKWKKSWNEIGCMVYRSRFLSSFPIFIVRQCISVSRGTFIDSLLTAAERSFGLK